MSRKPTSRPDLNARKRWKRHGYGSYTLPDGSSYEGDWKDGKRDGFGIYTSVDGSIYEGDWVDGKRHGHGRLTDDDGAVYEGFWVWGVQKSLNWVGGSLPRANTPKQQKTEKPKTPVKKDLHYHNGSSYHGDVLNRKKHGEGTYKLPNGSHYVGEWKDDKRHGHGVLTEDDGAMYEGEWAEGKRHGTGTQHNVDGTTYTGEYMNGAPHGRGKYSWADGTTFEGEFVNGARHGSGILTFPSGHVRAEEWRDDRMVESVVVHRPAKDPATSPPPTSGPKTKAVKGKFTTRHGTYDGEYLLVGGYSGAKKQKHGVGVLHMPNGAKYEGEWKNDKRHGAGVYVDEEGLIYTGDWEEGKRHGEGVVTGIDGVEHHGRWVRGVQVAGTHPNEKLHSPRKTASPPPPKMKERKIEFANGAVYSGEWVVMDH